MKRRTVKRGLYRRETLSTETADELFDALAMLSGDLDRYMAEAERVASDVLREARHDPDTLWDVVDIPGGRAVRYSLIDRDALPAEVDQALQVVLTVHDAREHDRNALRAGIRLAQAVERFNANRLWQKPVRAGVGTSKGGRKGAASTHGPKGSRAAEYQRAYHARRARHPDESRTASRKAVASQFDRSPKTIERATKGQ